MTAHIQLTTVDRRRGYIDATVTPRPGAEAHRVGYLRGEGWFCVTCGHSRCPHIATVRDLVPHMEQP